jgi:hypothetical protein
MNKSLDNKEMIKHRRAKERKTMRTTKKEKIIETYCKTENQQSQLRNILYLQPQLP